MQAHIHSGTEHTFDGSYNAAEMHMVHESMNNTGLLAVIAIIFQVGAPEEFPLLRTLLDEWIAVDQELKDQCAATEQQRDLYNDINLRHRSLQDSDTLLTLYDMVPANESFYRYEGGLTTPPCSEIVHWSVASRPLEISTRCWGRADGVVVLFGRGRCLSRSCRGRRSIGPSTRYRRRSDRIGGRGCARNGLRRVLREGG